MGRFKAVLLEHGYSNVQYERDIIEGAGGEFIDADALPLAEKLRLCQDADGVMVRRVELTREVIAGFRKCKALLRYGVGVDNIDLAAATEAGIIVTHVPIYCQDEVSVHAISLLLACVRRIIPTHQKMQAGGWDLHREEFVYRMAGKTLGLVGLGTLGQAVARKLQGWDLRLLATDPYIESEIARELAVTLVPLDQLLAESDYISLHVPLLPETRHLINARALERLKPGAILVNTARGLIVDTAAVLKALDAGRLGCAALDVFEEEPLPPRASVRAHPKVVLTDHMAWYSEDSQVELQKRAAQEMVRACTGDLPTAIANPEVLIRLGRQSEWTPNHAARWQARRRGASGLKSNAQFGGK